jgi:carbonic anhydrase
MTPFTTQMVFLVVASTSTRTCDAEQFAYDPASEFGPQNWAALDIENNQCGGNAQSGIDIASSSCNEYEATYTFNVSHR